MSWSWLRPGWLAVGAASCVALRAAAPPERGAVIFDSVPEVRLELRGPVGERARANLDGWLLRAPRANPGMLEMFQLRDRKPEPNLVPWAGEFVGKYLISAVQAMRLSEDPRLRQQTAEVVAGLVASQAEDGYLGPFPKEVRLLKHWDLWGHYHCIEGLLLWYRQTGDERALTAARRAGDLVCATYLDTGRRVLEAGDPEMNMAIIDGFGELYRLTGEPRYLRMMREIETDWEKAGDYLRAGLDGREFYGSPKPRWESLHDLQGLVELWRITGEAKYREAFLHHWRSIRRWDRRNTGGFSSGEQATGNPYAPSAIETCCTVAWMALSVDYLRLTGDAGAADDLELATLNAGLGAQHSSGCWWTYNTPMDGVREASAHTIVFQARAGTPELNCCSVNAPRVLGMLSEWGLMSAKDGLVVNWLGAGRFQGRTADGVAVTVTVSDDLWRTGRGTVRIESEPERAYTLRLRLPGWADPVEVALNGAVLPEARRGSYLQLRRRWGRSDELQLRLGLPTRVVPGAHEVAGKVSLYRGPVLLAYDQAWNVLDEAALAPLDLRKLGELRAISPRSGGAAGLGLGEPWVLCEALLNDGHWLRLVDFASAGSRGTRYRSWLSAADAPPPPVVTRFPADAARVPAGPVRFEWSRVRRKDSAEVGYRVLMGTNTTLASRTWESGRLASNRVVLDLAREPKLEPGMRYFWQVATEGASGETTIPEIPPAWFEVDPSAPPQMIPAEPLWGPQGELILDSLRGDGGPRFGQVRKAAYAEQGAEGTRLNGVDQMVVYGLPGWPEEDYSVRLSMMILELPRGRIGEAFSAWAAGMDDPLRLVVDGGKLYARIEAGGGFSTAGVGVEAGRWYQVAAVKRGGTLTLYVDGKAVGSCDAPESSVSQARSCALGGNPNYGGNECLAMRVADFGLYGRALEPAEIGAKP